MPIPYVLGFAFQGGPGMDTDVTLIWKKRPEWQAGKLNGVGGLLQSNETPVQAMVWEFREETGVVTQVTNWDYVCTMSTPEWEVIVYRGFFEHNPVTQTDEYVTIADTRHLPEQCIANIPWLVGMCLDRGKSGRYAVRAFIKEGR